MYDDTITLDRLEPNEQAVISAIRRWRDYPETVSCGVLPRVAREQIAALVAFLWRSDPFAVKVGMVFDRELRLFEVQLLYAISEQLAGKTMTTSEIIAWWFPVTEQSQARAALQSIGVGLSSAGVSIVSADWVRDYFQSMTLRRVRKNAELTRNKQLNEYAEPVSAMIH
jgi:hypothetical protein